MPLFRSTPHENHIALDRFRAVSSFSFRASLNRPNGLNRSKRYSITATMWTESKTSSHRLIWKGRRNESRLFLLDSLKKDVIQVLQVCNFLSDSLKFSKQKYRHTNLTDQFIMVDGLRLTVYLTSKLDKWLMDGLMWTNRVTLSANTSDALKGRETDRQPDWRTNSVTGRRIDSLMVDSPMVDRQADWRIDELTNWRTDGLQTDGLTN